MRILFFVLFGLFSTSSVLCQKREFEKIDKQFHQSPSPTSKKALELLNKQKEMLDFQSNGNWEQKTRYFKNYSKYFKNENNYNQSLKLAKKSLYYSQKSKIDTLQASCLHDISLIFIKLNDLDSAFCYLNKALPIFKKYKQYYNLTASLHTMSTINRKLGYYEEAFKNIQSALLYCDTVNDRSAFATILNSKGLNFQDIGKLDSAYFFYLKSLKIYVDSKDVKAQIRTNDQIGAVLYELSRLSEALIYFNKSLELGRTLNDPVLIGNSSINIGAIYFEQNKVDQALNYFLTALKTANAYNLDNIRGICYSNISDVYKEKKEYVEALNYAQKAFEIENKIGNPIELASCYLSLSDLAFDANRIELADRYIQNALILAKGFNDQQLLTRIYLQLSKVYSEKKDFELAHNYYLMYQQIIDKLHSIEVNDNIDKLKVKYETDIIALNNKKLRLENEKKKNLIALEKEKTTNLYYTFVVTIVFLLLIVVIFNFSLKNKKQRIQLLSAEKRSGDLIIKNKETELSAIQKVLIEKNKLIHSLEDKIVVEQNHELIANDLIQNLKDHSNWATFINQFEIIHSGYLSGIIDKHPDLTKNEIRLIVLEKLFLTTKEMAEILGISPESVTKGKQRLKKKLDLNDINEIKTFV